MIIILLLLITNLRLLKYPLLFNELLKQTLPSHQDYDNIALALQKLQSEVDGINKNKARNDNMKKMVEINKSMEGMPRGFKLLIPSRVPVFEGILRKISGFYLTYLHPSPSQF